MAYQPAPIGKILYDGSGYILTENFNVRWVQYGYYQTDGPSRYHLRFQTRGQNPNERGETVDIKRNPSEKLNLTFAIDIFSYARGYQVSCMQGLSKSLSEVIHNCYGNVVLRETLSEEEKAQIQKFKEEQESE